MATAELDCPVCANIAPHYSNDGGETWQCQLCLGVHDGGHDR
jgi:hypothetical protein